MTSAVDHIVRLCSAVPDRRPGSQGNVAASSYVRSVLERCGWATELQWFECVDWTSNGGALEVDGLAIDVVPSPYGLGVEVTAPLVGIATREQLARHDKPGDILLVHGELTARPLTPAGYPFYSVPEDDEVLSLLLAARPAAVIAMTGVCPDVCGAVDPFPWIEDGTFTVPVATVGREASAQVLSLAGRTVELRLHAVRSPSRAANVVARRGPQEPRVTVIAHLDSKPGTPGALDNAAGVAALLLAAEKLADGPWRRSMGVELLVVNGEDYYAASGEVRYLASARLNEVALAVNIDGVGLPDAPTAWSTYGCPDELVALLRREIGVLPGIVEGPPWFQSDHAVFAAQGRPAVAFTTSDLERALRTVVHSSDDTPERVDMTKVVEAAEALAIVVRAATSQDRIARH